MGREVLHGQNIKSGKELWSVAIFGHQQVEKAADGLGKVFSLFIAIDYNHHGTPSGLPEEDGVNRFRGGRQSGEGSVATAADAMQYVLESGMASQVEEQISNDRMNQGWLIILSTRLVVE